MAEGRVVDEDVFLGDAFRLQIAFKDIVGRTRVDIVGAQKREFLDAQLLEEIVGCRNGLLVRRGTGVEDVFRAFLAFVLNRVEQQAVQFLDNRQNRLAADAGPVAEDHIDLVHGQQFARLLGEERPVGRRVDDDGFEIAAKHAALLVLLFDQHFHRIFQSGLRNCHRA